MRRFKILPEQKQGNKITITGSDARHISKVLRLKPDSQVVVFDGAGCDYQIKLNSVSNNVVEGEIISHVLHKRESPIDVTLMQGLPKQAKMEVIVQKCTELGVARIKPLITERTVVNWDQDKSVKKVERWQKVAEEACKQSGRQVVPQVDIPLKIDKALESVSSKTLFLIPWEGENTTGIKEVLQGVQRDKYQEVCIAIGPEGGFSSAEVETAVSVGAVPVTLGKRILRTETAGMVTAAIVLYELGDLGGLQ